MREGEAATQTHEAVLALAEQRVLDVEPEGSVSLRARVEEVLPKVLPADAVILNPPRAGTDSRVTDALEQVAEKPRVIAYVSCNPATLARDISRLPGYRIASLVPLDMFPQTAHIETVCELVPEAA